VSLFREAAREPPEEAPRVPESVGHHDFHAWR